jgi:aconitate hydratase
MLIPRVVGFKLSGSIPAGATATDVVLTITEQLREHGVVGKFVEFYGEGVSAVPLANRATIGNMSPEFGSTCAIFPIDDVTLEYLRLTGRSEQSVALVEAYAKEQGMWLHAGPDQPEARYSERLELDLSTVVPSIAGPKRPQDRIALTDAKDSFRKVLPTYVAHHEGDAGAATSFPASDPSPQGSTDGTNGGDKPASEGDGTGRPTKKVSVTSAEGATFEIDHGIVAIASITSCTNTSNPSVMMAAAMLAKNAVDRGLTVAPGVKTSMAPGSNVV